MISMRSFICISAGAMFVFGSLAAVAIAEAETGTEASHDWPQFRGPNRDGISLETDLIETWPEEGPAEAWRIAIGEGFAGMSVAGHRLYTMYSGESGEKPVEFAAAFDARTGKEVWRTVVGEHLDTEFGNGPRSTPTVDGDSVYFLGSHGDLAAVSARDGAVQWSLSLTERFGGERPYWGFSTSALVDGDKLIIEGGGGEGKSYAALNKKSGETIWTSGDGAAGHNSPIRVEMMGATRYVFFAGGKLRCIDEDGNEVWAHDWPEGETHVTPVFVSPNRIYGSGVEGVGATMVKVVEASDKAEVEEVWKVPHLRNHFSTSVVHAGQIYGFDNATLKSVSVETGDTSWAKRGFGKGSLIFADGHLFVLSDSGVLAKVEATSDGYVEKGRVRVLEGRSWTAPTLANGTLFLRNHTEMVALKLKG